MSKALLMSAALCLAAQFSTPAQTAVPLEVRLICYDLLVYPATIEFLGGIEDQNRVSSMGRISQPNDEMAFAPPEIPTSHWGTFHYTDGQTFETFTMDFEINIPGRDANDNGIPDLLEFSQSVPQTPIIGDYFSSEVGDGAFRATWSKPAGSARGSVRILFDFLPNGPEFNHTFEVLNYSGTWNSAVRQAGKVQGPVTITREGTPTSTLSGQLVLEVGDDAKLITTSFLDENGARFEWPTADIMLRDRTEFYTFLNVVDGWLYEQASDFHDWIFIVDDKNDWDADGVPDLVDPQSTTTPPTAPTMQIIRTENGIRLSIVGDIGRAYTLESASNLPTAEWGNPTTVTLTANPHLLDLPAPTFRTFWRMRFP